jgi:hypothetical protein
MHCDSNPSILDRVICDGVIRASRVEGSAALDSDSHQTAGSSCPAQAGHPVRCDGRRRSRRRRLLDRPVKPGDDIEKDITAHSRGGFPPGLYQVVTSLDRQRAQGMPVRERTRSLVRHEKSTRVSHHRYAETSGIACAIGFNGCFVLFPGEPGL